MEDDLQKNGRLPLKKKEDDLKKTTKKTEDDLQKNGKRHKK
jgi:hypothetical protein